MLLSTRMAFRTMDVAQPESASDDSLPGRIAAIPLVLDDDPMTIDSEPGEDLEDEIVRQRMQATRTLFHQPRGDDDTVNSTRSLYDSDVIYHMIHGRRYCNDYYMPNDEEEQTRMQILHGVFYSLLGNQLTTVELSSPSKILDVGTGSGDWAMAMGDEYPDAEVIGTDIAKIQPSAVPLNVFFEIDDAEDEGGWTWPDDEFDLVHFRNMAGAFADWPSIYGEAYRSLKPGGWIEVIDIDINEKSILHFFEEGSALKSYMKALNDSAAASGKPRGVAHLNAGVFSAAGFVDVSVVEKVIPMGVWPEDKEDKKLGKHFLVVQLCGVESFCLRPLSEQMGWGIDKIRKLCDEVTQSVRTLGLDQNSKGFGLTVRIGTARKPQGFCSGQCGGKFGGRPPSQT